MQLRNSSSNGRSQSAQICPLLAAAVLLVSGCEPIEANSPPSEGYARFGQTVYVDGPRVTPLRLLEDSRCPARVACVWPGQVRISARIDLGSGSREVELNSISPLAIADGSLVLAEVQPMRMTTGAADAKDYRFRFTFAGGL